MGRTYGTRGVNNVTNALSLQPTARSMPKPLIVFWICGVTKMKAVWTNPRSARRYTIEQLGPIINDPGWNAFLLDSWRYPMDEPLTEYEIQGRWYYTFMLVKRVYEEHFRRKLHVFLKVYNRNAEWYEIDYEKPGYEQIVKRMNMFLHFIRYYQDRDIAWCIKSFKFRFLQLDIINQIDSVKFAEMSDIGKFVTDAKYYAQFNMYRMALRPYLGREPDWSELYWYWFEMFRKVEGKRPSYKSRVSILKRIYQFTTGFYAQYALPYENPEDIENLKGFSKVGTPEVHLLTPYQQQQLMEVNQVLTEDERLDEEDVPLIYDPIDKELVVWENELHKLMMATLGST